MRHPFLSEAWINEAHQVRDRYQDQLAPLGIDAKVNVVVTEVPFGDSPVMAHLTTESGYVSIDHGHLDGPDAIVTADYATARNLVVEQDQSQIMEAFMAGRITVQGDLNKLMELAAGAAPLDPEAAATTSQIGEEIRAFTA